MSTIFMMAASEAAAMAALPSFTEEVEGGTTWGPGGHRFRISPNISVPDPDHPGQLLPGYHFNLLIFDEALLAEVQASGLAIPTPASPAEIFA